jgi:DNA-binding NarL/FixJ family response regulator
VCVFHGECRDLLPASPHDGADDAPVRARLSPRQRQTLALVLHGLCDKEIAERLGISRYTVNQYTKVIYRQYTVTSRAQLLARMLTRPQVTNIP